jgi:glycosyltransferase involved in cell wall biosynthesis
LKILFVTQWFDPEPTFKGLTFAKELVRRGHQVEVLTGFPNYPGGRLYPGYSIKSRHRETMEGIPVTRVALYPSHDGSVIRRAANYGSFALTAATIGAASVGRPDVAYVYHPPATIALPAMVLKVIRRVPFVLDVQDLWPDTLAATGMVKNGAVLRAVGSFCHLAYRSASRVVVLSPGFKSRLVERGVPSGKIEVVYNWCHEAAIDNTHAEAPILKEVALDGRFNVVFAGTMGRAQALSSVLHAAAIVTKREPRVQFVFVGGGIDLPALKAQATDMALKNVVFLPVRPASDIAPLLAAAHVLLVHLRDDPLFSITIPSKTQAYMAAGRPVLMAVRGDAAALIRDAKAGTSVTPEDPGALAAAVCELSRMAPAALTAMGTRARAYYQQCLSLSAGVDRFVSVFGDAAHLV